MFSGVKTKYGTMGYDSSIDRYAFESMNSATKVDTIMTWAQQAQKATGLPHSPY